MATTDAPEEFRHIYLNDAHANAENKYTGNGITTSKYTVLTFLPKNLFEQFRRVANLYFLVIAVLQLLPLDLSPISPITSILPLMFVLSVTAGKEIYEDYRRHRRDKLTNNSPCRILRDRQFHDCVWTDVVVGDVLQLHGGDPIPADILLLSSSEPLGMAYVETSNLDGETNLKIRQAIAETQPASGHEASEEEVIDFLYDLQGSVQCEQPNRELYRFNGFIDLDQQYPLGPKQVLLRGTSIRNTKVAYGLVLNTGNDTKLMQNSTDPPAKRSNLEISMNKQILSIFAFQLTLCFVCGLIGGITRKEQRDPHWYLDLRNAERGEPPIVGTLGFFTFLILYNTMIPISLYVSMELVKVVQAFWIYADRNMFYALTKTPAMPRTSNLNEELGQVQFIFSDKTGTLTCNVMEFLKCSVGGVMYGTGTTEIARAAAKRQGKELPPPPPRDGPPKPGDVPFEDPKFMKHLYGDYENSAYIEDFLVMLAVCHTVIPEENDDGEIEYRASSPDEFALVHAARALGFYFHGRDTTSVTITKHMDTEDEEEETYEILNVLEFNSTRKRMSVIVRCPDGTLKLYCKGADSVIYERLGNGQKFDDRTHDHLEILAAEGLRTLCFAAVELDEDEYEDWAKIYKKASLKLEGRDEAVADAAELIEQNLFLIGASAIEDKLQDGVPATIETLAEAGIKIWVLTGDKQETAINIGFACAVLHNAMHLITINDNKREKVLNKINKGIETAEKNSGKDIGLVIDGTALTHALHPECGQRFLALGILCKAVICCRVSPSQKAEVVDLVKLNMDQITLAIGDGANDVGMIQAAQIGIGIEGEEGKQAANTSDYSIAQFRYLQPLLLVHGRWSYQRIAILILYSFYKNMAFSLTQFWFALFSAFTGQTLFDSLYIAVYNVTSTFLPIMMVAIFDQDVSAGAVQEHPFLYHPGQHRESFNAKMFWMWLLNGAFHSLIFYFTSYFAFGRDTYLSDGQTGGVWVMGVFAYSLVVVTVNLKIALHTRYWTFFNHFCTWGTIIFWFILAAVYASLGTWVPNAGGVAYMAFSAPTFWFALVIGSVAALVPDYVVKAAYRNFFPQPVHIVQEMEKLGYERKHDEFELNEDYHATKGVGGRRRGGDGPTGFAFAQEPGLPAQISPRGSDSGSYSESYDDES
eukprot:TRINITY_DN2587_c0_g3_i1.p1 TRINITY_DN2587_c0_g3~~TRINITY_DN2587_c0_g3_i1.p1  ORF type:complete len:1153 (+),score=165.86 TRINITY_DN2587_c0_g3_i1:130-3588(+)